MKSTGQTRTEALSTVRRTQPHLVEALGKGITPPSSDLKGMPSTERIEGDHARKNWLEAVARIQDRLKCSYAVILQCQWQLNTVGRRGDNYFGYTG